MLPLLIGKPSNEQVPDVVEDAVTEVPAEVVEEATIVGESGIKEEARQ